ncbi:MAG: M20 family peptidase [Desulfarculus sp.]|nr:MAG: M20 family peptidase [Desulfarculus sp.]
MDPREPAPLELAAQLIRINSCNPPGGEAAMAACLAPLLSQAGYELSTYEFAPGRPSLVARQSWGPQQPLCFSAHMDTVPLGAEAWRRNPFGGQVEGGRLHGRGACDMKGGLAAMVTAACSLAALKPRRAGLVLVLSAGEETGCQGAFHLAAQPGALGQAAAVLVGEPTGNRPLLGHKGALWLRASFSGRAAHGSMPQLGDNAVLKAARAALALSEHDFGLPPHPILGPLTVNVGLLSGGHKVNMVPDQASLAVDLRTLPGLSHDELAAAVARLLPASRLERLMDAEAIWTEAADPWAAQVLEIASGFLGQAPPPAGAAYFTDGSALQRALGHAPTLLLGPGRPEQAHTADEWCAAAEIGQAVEMYLAIARAWCGA